MADLFKYSLADAVPFGPEVYDRLFVLLNQDVWPAQVAWLAAGAVMLWLIVRENRFAARVSLAGLGIAWLCVAYVFFLGRYQTLNWAGAYMAVVALVFGLALVVFAGLGRQQLVVRREQPAPWIAGFTVLAIGLLLYPLQALAMQGSLSGAQVFGVTLDPTAVACLGLGALMRSHLRWLVIALPIVWCIATALTLWVLGRADFALPLVLTGLAVVAASVPRVASGADGSGPN